MFSSVASHSEMALRLGAQAVPPGGAAVVHWANTCVFVVPAHVRLHIVFIMGMESGSWSELRYLLPCQCGGILK